LLFSESRRTYLPYRVRANRWIALGATVGDMAEREGLMWRFVEMADRAGGTAVFYSAPAALLPALAGMGFIIRQIGEAAVVDTQAFSLTGKSRQNLRTACNKAAAEGCSFEVLPPGSAGPLAAELKAVSDAWLNNHASAEKGFTMGRFDLAYLDLGPLAVVRKAGHVVAFSNVLRGTDTAGIDLMRYSGEAPTAVMDFLFVRLIEWARDQGYATFNLGMAPLSGLENRRLAPVFARLGALVFAEAGRLYSFGGLHAYKAKFGPEWRPMYMAGRPGVIMPLALLDVALLTGGGWRGLFLK
jgi:phosphatidylglycerol lysyltransferase